MTDVSPLLASPVARLGAYGLILVAVLGGGAAVGAAWGPGPSTPAVHAADDEAMDMSAPAGLGATQDGYRLQLVTPTIDAGVASRLELVVRDPDGAVLTDYRVAHERELHLVVVSRDLRTYAHLHPSRDDAGTWSVEAPALPAGPYRAYADLVPAGADGVTLAADLGVAGPYAPQPVPTPSDEATVDGYDVSFDGALIAGAESELTVTVTRDGEPVTDLQPYLGALGHLVAIRDGDLAFLHVHPIIDADGPGGPTVRFAVHVPSAGTYGLFFDFAHDGDVHDASIVTTAVTGTDHGSHEG